MYGEDDINSKMTRQPAATHRWCRYIIAFFVLSPFGLLGQAPEVRDELRFAQMTVNDGLISNKVNDITQDANGYIWFGSDEGLSRFDGYGIRNYQHDDYDSLSISSNVVFTLFTDSQGLIWVGLRYGLDLYDASINQFSHPKYQEKSLTNVRDFFEDQNGRVWICAEEGLFYYEPDTRTIHDYQKENISFVKSPMHSFYKDSREQLWIGSTYNGLSMVDVEGNTHHFKQTTGFRIENIIEHEDKMWVCTYNNGLFKYDPADSSLISVDINKSRPFSLRIREMRKDRKGNLWLGTRDGLYMKTAGEDRFILMGGMEMKFAKIGHNSVFSLFIDEFDIIWLGSFSGGVNYADLNQKMFRSIGFDEHELENSLNDNSVFSILEDKDKNLWFGTESGGVNFYNSKTGKFSYFLSNPAKDGITAVNIHALAETPEHKLWVGTYDAGLVLLDPAKRSFKNYVKGSGPCALNTTHIYSILQDSKGIVWVGTDAGICKYQDDCFDCLELKDLARNGQINHIYEDSKGRIWFGTLESGIFLYDEGGIRPYLPDIITRTINVTYEDSNGNLWFGCHENGLILHRPDTIVRYTLHDGIPNGTVQAILEDDEKNLWFSTSAGLIRFNNGVENPIVENPSFNLFDVTNGITSNQFNFASSCKLENGMLYFGTIGGVTYFDPKEIELNTLEPKLIITNLLVSNVSVQPQKEINGRVILTKDISSTESIELNHDDNYLTLEFAAIHYSNPNQHQYQYMLVNYDEDWINTTADKRYVTYTNLPGGNYTFKVRGTNYDGVWNSEVRSLNITINPPWHQLAWVRVIIAIALVLAILAIIKVRTSFLERQKINLKNEVNKRTLQIQQQSEEIEKQNATLTQTIEKLKSTQLKLIDAEKMSSLGQLTAGIAHEINNPANFIYGGVQGLEKDLNKIREFTDDKLLILNKLKKEIQTLNPKQVPEEVLELLEGHKTRANGYIKVNKNLDVMLRAIRIGAERTVEIVKGLRAFSRIEDKEFTPTDLHENIDDTLLLLNHKVKNRIEVVKKYGQLPLVQCNPGRLNQVFMNILANAIHSIDERGKITIETKKVNGNEIRISFSDTGSGMDEHTKNKIFDPFFTTKIVGEGTGLGLSISKGIVEEHNGRIYMESQESKGTTFFIEIPVRH